MTDPGLIREVDDDLERQRLNDMWRRFGPLVIVAALLIVCGTAGYTAWHSWRVEGDQQATAGLLAATEKADAPPAAQIDALEKFAHSAAGKPQAVLAQLTAANLAARQGDKAKAMQIYDAVAQDDQADTAFRQFATLLSVEAQMDSAAPAALRARLQGLTGADQPWHYTAQEDDGYLALKAGDRAAAREIFTALSQDANAPPTLNTRAGEIARWLAE